MKNTNLGGLTLSAKVEQLPQWMQFVAACAQQQDLPSKRIREIELALEEAIVNICHYAYPADSGEIAVTCTVDAQQCFTIEIVDWGVPFDPLSLAAPGLTDDLADRQVGGLGVFLIRKLMDDVTYRRDNDCNILQLMVHRPLEG
jgi:anti-sigma regulatory factor (Ser/Thr protein kinase)